MLWVANRQASDGKRKAFQGLDWTAPDQEIIAGKKINICNTHSEHDIALIVSHHYIIFCTNLQKILISKELVTWSCNMGPTYELKSNSPQKARKPKCKKNIPQPIDK